MQIESWLDILNYVSPEPRDWRPGEIETIWLVVSPEMMYERAKENLLGRLRNPNLPDGILAVYYNQAKQIDPRVWSNLQISGSIKSLDPNFRAVRAFALDILRLWFTEHLTRIILYTGIVGPERRLGLHIGPKDLRYKD